MLPADLQAAEAQALQALRSALSADAAGRWILELRFEGLRLLPVALRLADRLLEGGTELQLLFPDAGATALARRDGPELAERIASFADQRRLQPETPSQGVLLLVAPSQAEYEEVEQLCTNHRGAVVLLNPSLEDAAVGIGSVARQRRRGFLSVWQAAYALIPQAASALRRAHPGPWELYRLDADGFRLVAETEQKPDGEQQEELLLGAGAQGLGSGLRSLNQLIEGLQR
ncbi:MAG: DUF1995 family protein [Cyanobacteriota bacterium]|jgi:hypothetical protein